MYLSPYPDSFPTPSLARSFTSFQPLLRAEGKAEWFIVCFLPSCYSSYVCPLETLVILIPYPPRRLPFSISPPRPILINRTKCRLAAHRFFSSLSFLHTPTHSDSCIFLPFKASVLLLYSSLPLPCPLRQNKAQKSSSSFLLFPLSLHTYSRPCTPYFPFKLSYSLHTLPSLYLVPLSRMWCRQVAHRSYSSSSSFFLSFLSYLCLPFLLPCLSLTP